MPVYRLSRWLVSVIVFCGVLCSVATATPAHASCDWKAQLVPDATARLKDSTRTKDVMQEMRDAEAFVRLTFAVNEEDCVGESDAMTDLRSLLQNWRGFYYDLIFSTTGIMLYGPNAELSADVAILGEDTRECRLYARWDTAQKIRTEALELRNLRASSSRQVQLLLPTFWEHISSPYGFRFK